MSTGNRLYIVEWALFVSGLAAVICAQSFPSVERGSWYIAAGGLVLASAAMQGMRWWGSERYRYTPGARASGGSTANGTRTVEGRPIGSERSYQLTGVCFSRTSPLLSHSGRLVICSILAVLT